MENDKETQRKIMHEVYKTSANSAVILGYFAIGTGIVFLISSFSNKALDQESLFRYRFLYTAYILISILFIGLNHYVKKNFHERFVLLYVANPVFAAISFIWAMGIAWEDYTNTGANEPLMYMTIALAVPLCIYIDPWIYCIIGFLSDYMMLTLYGISAHRSGQEQSLTTTYLILFFIIQISMGYYMIRLKKHLSERILHSEMQKDEIKDLSMAQNSFFASMSHEIRTPINTIIGLDEMILRNEISDEVREDAENIQSAGKILLHLLNDLLDISKIESGMMKLTLASYNTKYMFYEIWGMMNIRAQEKGVSFSIELSPDIPRKLLGDEVRIKQILINLINNSIKYTKKGFVSLKVECKQNASSADVVYTVVDSGIGIRGESLPHLFTAYKRVNEEKTKYIEGTGLGLSIVKQLLNMMEGDIEVTSTYGVGSSFKVTIPQQVIDSECIGEFDVSDTVGDHDNSVYNTRFTAPSARVLIVDDTPANIVVAKKLLRDTQVIIDTAESGREALEKTEKYHYDVIFMDHFMPNMDGIECAHRIRKQFEGKCKTDTKIVVLTANVAPENEAMYIKAGFDGYLTKPVSGIAIEAELLKHLSKDIVNMIEVDESVEAEPDEDLNETLKNIFVSSIDETARKLEKFLQDDDIENYTITVHGLKSTARLAGEMDISAKAEVLEEAGKNNDKEIIGRLHADFITEYLSCKGLNTKKSEVKTKGAISGEELNEAYMTISEYAYAKDYTTLQSLLNSLDEYELDEKAEESVKRLKNLLDNMDYDSILAESKAYCGN